MVHPQAPVDMAVEPTFQMVWTAANFIFCIVVTIGIWRKTKGNRDYRNIALMVLAGGALATFYEPFGDWISLVWHPIDGQWTVLEQYGHSVPLWILLGYYWYMGGQTLYVMHRVHHGADKAELWKMFFIFCAVDALVEFPLLHFSVYAYFGNQPLWHPEYFKLPLWFLVTNGLWPIIAAAAVGLITTSGNRKMLPLIPVALVMGTFGAYTLTGWPVFAVLNVENPDEPYNFIFTQLSGLATVGMVFLLTKCVIDNLVGKAVLSWDDEFAESLPSHQQPQHF